MPKVSIVIPTYNMAEFLPVALESSLGQDYTDTEIIVVNDGSTDDTETAVRPYLPQVRYQRQENQGLVATLKRGMEIATGQYICFLDADDALCPYTVSAQVEQLDRNPCVGLVFGRAFEMDSLGKVIGLHNPFPGVKRPTLVPSPQAFRWLLRGSGIQKSTVMIAGPPSREWGRSSSNPGQARTGTCGYASRPGMTWPISPDPSPIVACIDTASLLAPTPSAPSGAPISIP